MSWRIAPSTTRDTAFFWDGVKARKLLIQRCAGCQALRHPPRPMCPECNALDWDTVEVSGRGRVYSFVIPRHPPFPWMEQPYVVALVELEEGTRLISNLCHIAPEEVRIGMRVQAYFEEFDEGVVLPLFRPVEDR
jgi:uncharacterized OB-fold protein